MVAHSSSGWTFGYARVSSLDQNEARQLAAFEKMGIEHIFVDRASGRSRNRPELEKMLSMVREGDVVVVTSPDRLARDTVDLLEIARDLNDRGVSLEFIDTPMLNIDSAAGEFMLTIYGGFATMERRMIRERQAQGIAIAKQQGKYRKEAALSPVEVIRVRERVAIGVPKAQVAREFGVSRRTIYNALAGEGIYGEGEYGQESAPIEP